MSVRSQQVVRMVLIGSVVACCVVSLVVAGVQAVISAGKNKDAQARVDAAMVTLDADPQAAMDVLLAEIDANPDMSYATDHDKLGELLGGFPADVLLAAAAGGAEAGLGSNPEMIEMFEILCYTTILGTYPDSPEALQARTGLLTGAYYVEYDAEVRERVVGSLAAVDDPAFFEELIARSQPDPGSDETLDEGEWEGKIAAQHTLAAKGQAGWEVLAAQVLGGDSEAAAAFESGGAGVVAFLEGCLDTSDTYARQAFAATLEQIALDSEHVDYDAAREVLLARVTDPYVAMAALDFYMHEGNEDSLPYLISGLDEAGGETEAEAFLNSGNGDLEAAGRSWASSHGYDITTVPSSSGSGWGGQ
jgi:hypothetical protein